MSDLTQKPSVGGFRLDLGEPLASQLAEFCKKNYRKKTEVIREAVTQYLDRWAVEADKKSDGQVS